MKCNTVGRRSGMNLNILIWKGLQGILSGQRKLQNNIYNIHIYVYVCIYVYVYEVCSEKVQPL